MLRFAPSPTEDMSIASLRVAIFNYILSKQLNEQLLIRIEDIEKEKIIDGKDKEILEILSLFSIDYSHVVYQSENLKYHQKLAMQLMSKKKAFSCFCSDEKLEELKIEAKKDNKAYEYDGFCATLSDETVLNVNSPFTVRIKKPELSSKIDSFIILNHDKNPTYNYACAVDDMLYDISTVIRSEKYLHETVKQVFVRNALNYEKQIGYIHLPEFDSSITSVKSLIDDGFLPSAIANYLVLLGNKTEKEIFTLEEAVEWFDINKLSKENQKFDMEELKLLNKKHLETIDNMRLSKILGFADVDIGKLGKIFIKEVSTINEIKSKIDAIFAPKTTCKGFEQEFKKIKEVLKDAPYFDKYENLENYLTEQTNLKDENLFKPLEYILTGKNDGVNISDIYPLIKNYLGEIIK